MKKVEVVAAIIKYNNKVLCCQREHNKLTYLSEKWEFPGGKIEKEETKEQALIREIDEELGMDIQKIQYALTVIHNYPDFELTMHTYTAETKQNNYSLNVHKDACWTTVDNFNSFDWAAADLPIVKFLQK